MRNFNLEKVLCGAIKEQFVVRLQYKKQLYWRTFEPHAVYESTKDNILVAGTQTKDDSKLICPPEPRNFETEQITGIKVTDETFKKDVRFDRFDKKYKNGFICVIKP